MITIYGKYTNAIVYTTDNEQYAIDDYARKQLQMICDHPSAAGSKIRVMPDVHPGKVGTIGLTMTVGESLMPNLVGVDIGCGMTIAKIKTKGMECQKLDTVIRDHVPVGGAVRKTSHKLADKTALHRLHCYKAVEKTAREPHTTGISHRRSGGKLRIIPSPLIPASLPRHNAQSSLSRRWR